MSLFFGPKLGILACHTAWWVGCVSLLGSKYAITKLLGQGGGGTVLHFGPSQCLVCV